jgi:murein tripeptide amidase MpaA
MPDVQFDRYYRYEPLTEILKGFAEEFPNLVRLASVGQSYEGRDIWLVTMTNFETGPADEKPALWVDGNIHASEVSPSSACLHLINKLTSEYGTDEDITRVLDTRVFYICPRVNPDGAEKALADKPYIIRSGTRPYPYDEEPLPGLVNEDIDGDGRILMMRVPDPNGEWKAHPDEPRLLVRRDPTETGGQYYRVLPEGYIEDYDGITITSKRKKEGLDFNRNFPSQWRQDNEQSGAGPYPTSEPEVRAIVDFIAQHKNITGGVTFHTWSGVLLRPYGTQSDETFPAEDLWTYQKIGDKGTEVTGYPAMSVYHDFRYHPKQVITGVFDDWLYEHYGLFAWTVELWSPQQQVGLKDYHPIDWFREHPVEDDIKLLEWSDNVLNGEGYVEWYSYDHPQLGPVELGGWNMLYAWRNPPPQFLEKEIAPFADWLVWHLLISPRLETYKLETIKLGEGVYRLRLALHNTGWLPTYVSKKALEKKVTRGVICEIELPEEASLQTGKLREDIGQLEGRAYTPSAISVWNASNAATTDRAKVEWVVQAPQGSEITIVARHDRAGVIRERVVLD